MILIVGTFLFTKSTNFGVEKSCITFGQNAFKKISKSVLMQTSPFSLSPSWKKPAVKYHLSIFQCEVTHEMTPKSRKVKISIDNDHLSLLSDHLMGLLK